MDSSEKICILGKPRKKTVRLITVEPVILLYSAVVGIQMTATQDLFSTKTCFQYLNTTDVNLCRNISGPTRETIKSLTAEWLVYYSLLKTILPVMFSFWIGSWNEMLGWKWPMLLPSSFSIFAGINYLVSSVYLQLPTEILLISPLLAGLSTDLVGIYCSCYGFISDTVDVKSRSKRMTVLQAASVIGSACGGFVSKVLMARFSFAVVYVVIITIHVTVVLYILFFIPNIRSKGARNPKGICDYFDLRNVVQSFRAVVRKRDGSTRREIVLIYIAIFFQYIGMNCFISLAYVFVTDEPISWNADMFSLLSGVKYCAQALGLLVVLPFLFSYAGLKDHITGILSCSSRMAGLIFTGLSTNEIMLFIAASFFLFADADIAVGRSLLTSRVQSEEKAVIFANVGVLLNVSMLVVSAVFTSMYPVFSPFFKGLPFEIAGVLQLVPISVYIFLGRQEKKSYPF